MCKKGMIELSRKVSEGVKVRNTVPDTQKLIIINY